MLTKMICKNMDKKNALLCAFSIALSVAMEMFFGVFLRINDKYGLDEKAASMDWLCTAFFLMAGAVSVFFTLYSTGCYVRTKNRDYSLLLMLGSSRKFIFRFFTIEFLLIHVFSLILGILAGGASSVLLLRILKLLPYPVTFAPSDALPVIRTVLGLHSMLFLLELLLILVYFCKRNLWEMQLRGSKREKRHSLACFLTIAGIFLIAYAMRLLRSGNLLYHFVSMPLCLAGIYILMSFGGSLVLMLIKLSRKFYYRHLITLNAFYCRFKSNCRLLFIMLTLDFVILFFAGGSVISQMPEDVDSPEYPFGFVGVMADGDLKNDILEILGSDGMEIPAVRGYLSEEAFAFGETSCFCISDRDYSRLTSHSLRLETDEAVWINETTALDTEKPDLLYLGGDVALTITEAYNEIVFGIEKPDCLRGFAVLPETAAADCMGEGYSILVKEGSLRTELEEYSRRFPEDNPDLFWRRAFLADAGENMVFVKIVSIFAGIFCLLSCFGIFALKMQGDLPSLQRKYQILHQLGMPRRALRRAVSAEYGQILAIPVILSTLLSGVYIIAEMTDREMLAKYYLGRYLPFQFLFLCVHILYFVWINKKILWRV